MSKRSPHPRTQRFHWDSKPALFDYFTRTHGLAPEVIEVEIAKAMHGFKLRQGQTIKTQELWEKVGLALARRCGDRVILSDVAQTGGKT